MQWPPNHRMESFSLTSIADEDDLSVCKVTSIASNEVEKSGEVDDVDGDFKILGTLAFEVRVERLGSGDGRTYTVSVACGAESEMPRMHTFVVVIPHDWSK